MTRIPGRALFIAILMASTALSAKWLQPSKHLSDEIGQPNLESLFPKSFGSWQVDRTGHIILPSPDVQAVLNRTYNQVLSRTYVDTSTGRSVMLSVAYGSDQSGGTRAHRPEVCYPAQGFQITYSREVTIQIDQTSMDVKQLIAKLGGRIEPITYWIVVGKYITNSHWKQRVAELRYSMQGLIADGMLVRVSSIDADMVEGYRLQSKFIQDLSSAVDKKAGQRMFGASSGI